MKNLPQRQLKQRRWPGRPQWIYSFLESESKAERLMSVAGTLLAVSALYITGNFNSSDA